MRKKFCVQRGLRAANRIVLDNKVKKCKLHRKSECDMLYMENCISRENTGKGKEMERIYEQEFMCINAADGLE